MKNFNKKLALLVVLATIPTLAFSRVPDYIKVAVAVARNAGKNAAKNNHNLVGAITAAQAAPRSFQGNPTSIPDPIAGFTGFIPVPTLPEVVVESIKNMSLNAANDILKYIPVKIKANPITRNVAIAGSILVTAAGAYYFFGYQPAATLATAGATQVVEEVAKVGTQVVQEGAKVCTEGATQVVGGAPEVSTEVVEEVATLATAGATKVVEEVAKVGTEVSTQVGEPNVQGAPKDAASEVPTQILEEGAKPSAYSYVSGLIGAAFAKAKSVSVSAMQATLVRANENKEKVAVVAAIGSTIFGLRIKDAALKAQAAQEVAKDSVVQDTDVTPA